MVFGVDQPVGRPPGVLNKDTRDFKQAVSNLLEHAAPKMVEWLDAIAQDNPSKALDHIAGFAEYVFPKLSRAENINKTVGILQIVLEAGKQQGLVVDNAALVKATESVLLPAETVSEAVGMAGSVQADVAPEGAKE